MTSTINFLPSTNRDEVQKVVERLESQFGKRVITEQNIVDVVLQGMMIAKDFAQLNGFQKKQVVCDAVILFISRATTGTSAADIAGLITPKLIDNMYYVATQGVALFKRTGCWC